MNPFLFFLFIITVVTVSFILGHQIGYLAGKAEVSHIPRGDTSDDSVLPPIRKS